MKQSKQGIQDHGTGRQGLNPGSPGDKFSLTKDSGMESLFSGSTTNPEVIQAALGAGYRNNNGNFNNLSNNANFWSSSENSTSNGINRNLNYNNANVNRNNNNKTNGFSVRCVRTHHQGSNNPSSAGTCNSMSLLNDLFTAYFDARKNKRNTRNALAFEMHFEHELIELYYEIINRQYKIRPSIAFIVDKPVKREIFAADFRDRVVHHLLFNYINPIFEKTFINDSYSCRKYKGTHYGIKRLEHFIRSCSQNYQKDCWILKLDIEGYFMSMNRQILFEKVRDQLLKNKRHFRGNDGFLEIILYLIELVIFNDPTSNFIIKGKKSDWDGLPSSKSLFHSKPGHGFPIGNLTSQLFSNIYLNELDHFIKEEIRFKYFGRYVDDFVIIHEDKRVLVDAIQLIRTFLQERLQVTLHPRKIYLQHYTKGVRFLGAIIKPWRKYINHRTKGSFYQKIRDIQSLVEETEATPELKVLRDIQACMNSYLGGARHFNSFRLRRKLIRNMGRLLRFYNYSNNYEKLNLKGTKSRLLSEFGFPIGNIRDGALACCKTEDLGFENQQEIASQSGQRLQHFQAEAFEQMATLNEAFQGFSPCPAEGLNPFSIRNSGFQDGTSGMESLGVSSQGLQPLQALAAGQNLNIIEAFRGFGPFQAEGLNPSSIRNSGFQDGTPGMEYLGVRKQKPLNM